MTDLSNNPYHIDWDVAKDRVEGSGSSTCWFWFFSSTDGRRYSAPGFTFDGGVASAKDSATFDAVEKANCDALLGCMYRTTKTSKCLGIYKETISEVKGFPANVKSIELIQERPVAWLRQRSELPMRQNLVPPARERRFTPLPDETTCHALR